jgi:hypothetical protein
VNINSETKSTKRTFSLLAKLDDVPPSYPAVSRPAFSSIDEDTSPPKRYVQSQKARKSKQNPNAELLVPLNFFFCTRCVCIEKSESSTEHRICEYHGRATASTSPSTLILKVMEYATKGTALDVCAVVAKDEDLAMCMAKTMGNAKAEIRWEPTEFRYYLCSLIELIVPSPSRFSLYNLTSRDAKEYRRQVLTLRRNQRRFLQNLTTILLRIPQLLVPPFLHSMRIYRHQRRYVYGQNNRT